MIRGLIMSRTGTVYLICFHDFEGHKAWYKHAGHYIGFAEGNTAGLIQRLKFHRCGRGARLIQVIQENGLDWKLARVWRRKSRKFERKLKNRGGARRICPFCNQRMKTMKPSKKLLEQIKDAIHVQRIQRHPLLFD